MSADGDWRRTPLVSDRRDLRQVIIIAVVFLGTAIFVGMNLNQVTVPSKDLRRSVHFYKILGLRLIVDALPRYVRFECPDGGATFSIHLVEDLPTGHGVVVYFECSDLDERVSALQAAGVEFDLPPTDQSWLWREARLRDPDGNALILYSAGENRRFPPWRVTDGPNR